MPEIIIDMTGEFSKPDPAEAQVLLEENGIGPDYRLCVAGLSLIFNWHQMEAIYKAMRPHFEEKGNG